MARAYIEREMRMLVEYILMRWPGREFSTRVRLGPPPEIEVEGFTPEQVAGAFKPTHPMADGVVYDPPDLWLIEAKVDNESQALGQLALYRRLAERTPGLLRSGAERIRPLLLMARRIPDVISLAAEMNVEVDFFTPEWLREFIRTGYPRVSR